jgi:hypothetical protein
MGLNGRARAPSGGKSAARPRGECRAPSGGVRCIAARRVGSVPGEYRCAADPLLAGLGNHRLGGWPLQEPGGAQEELVEPDPFHPRLNAHGDLTAGPEVDVSPCPGAPRPGRRDERRDEDQEPRAALQDVAVGEDPPPGMAKDIVPGQELERHGQ